MLLTWRKFRTTMPLPISPCLLSRFRLLRLFFVCYYRFDLSAKSEKKRIARLQSAGIRAILKNVKSRKGV